MKVKKFLKKIIYSNDLTKFLFVKLKKVFFKPISQSNENLILNKLIEKYEVGKTFLEIGFSPWEFNCADIADQNEGFIIDADKENIKIGNWLFSRTKFLNEFIDLDNIDDLIKNINKKTDILSLDIDGNDYWILNEINIESDLVVCEYNPILGDLHELTIPYEKKFDRKNKHFSNLFFGCSIQALIQLMKKKNYIFLGTNTQGMNAFFINKRKLKYVEHKIKEKKIFFPMTREGREKDGKLNYKTIFENLKLIENEQIYDIRKKEIKKISDFKNLYSDKWIIKKS